MTLGEFNPTRIWYRSARYPDGWWFDYPAFLEDWQRESPETFSDWRHLYGYPYQKGTLEYWIRKNPPIADADGNRVSMIRAHKPLTEEARARRVQRWFEPSRGGSR